MYILGCKWQFFYKHKKDIRRWQWALCQIHICKPRVKEYKQGCRPHTYKWEMNPSTFTAMWPYVLTLRSEWPLFLQRPQGSIPSLPHTGKEALSFMGSAEAPLHCFRSDCHYHCWDCPLSPGGPSCSHNRNTTCEFPWSLNTPLAIVLHALSYAWESSQVSYVHRLNPVSWHLCPLCMFSSLSFPITHPVHYIHRDCEPSHKYGFPWNLLCSPGSSQHSVLEAHWTQGTLSLAQPLRREILFLWLLLFMALGNSYKNPSHMTMWQTLS